MSGGCLEDVLKASAGCLEVGGMISRESRKCVGSGLILKIFD